MKYEQPYGVSDPNASYVNGNPATGTPGSIPPAASIEYPQREIVNFISDNGAVTPADTDLHQLGKSVQSGGTNYAQDAGTATNVILALHPVPDAYYVGMVLRFKALHAPAVGMTLDAGRGPKPILKAGGGPLVGGEWQIADIVTVTYDGAHWQMPTSPITYLYTNKDYYVATTGSDSNDGLTVGTPFATLQKAWNTAQLYNLNGYNITIHVADGTYNQAMSSFGVNGSGQIKFLGNVANPQNVIIQAPVGPALAFGGSCQITINGMRLSSLANAPGQPSAGVWSSGGANVWLYAVDFDQAHDGQILALSAGSIGMYGPIRISGSAPAHLYAASQGYIQCQYPAPTLQILNSVAYSTGFAYSPGGTITNMPYASIAGAAFVTGPRYLASMNGVVNSNGSGVNYFPGTVAGSVQTGGQYV